jgi:PAS domain S-box-containing protein
MKQPERTQPARTLAWATGSLAVLLLAPGATVLGRLKRRTGEGVEDEPRAAAAEPLTRLRAALTRAETARDAVDALFDAVAGLPGSEVTALALVDEGGTRAAGFAARGTDEERWRGVSVDLEREAGAVATTVRERSAFAVYDVASSPTVSPALAAAVNAKSAALVPLVAEDRAVAVLILATTVEPRFFSSAELETVQRLADEAAPVLARVGSASALRRALEREKLVTEIARKVRSELDLDDVLQVAVTETGRALGVARCYIRFGDESSETPVRAEWRRPGLEPIARPEQLPLANLALREGRTVAIGDVTAAGEHGDPERAGMEILAELGTRAALATPIVVFDRTIGVFGLHRTETGAWSASEIVVAEAVAGEVGIAVHAARLLEEDERRLGLQGALLKAAQVVTSDLRFESVLRRLVEEVAILFGADAADCWMFEPGTGQLRSRAVYGLPEDEELGRTIPVGGAQARAIAAAAPVLARDFARTEEPRPTANYAGFEEIMIAPMIWLGEVRGVLGVCSREAGRFDSSELEILEAFARFASLASHNAESYEERARQAQIQQGFYRIAEVLGSPLSLAKTLDALGRAAAEALGGDTAAVLSPRGGRLCLDGSYRLPARLAERLRDGLPEPTTPLAGAASDGRILTSGVLRGDDRFDEEARGLLAEHGYGALLAAPVQRGSGESAVVVVLFGAERTFTDDDLVLARQLGAAARGALERSELFEAERRARGLSERLASVGARLVTSLTPERVLEEVAAEAASIFEAHAAVLRVLEGEELVTRSVAGAAPQSLVGSRSSSGHGLLGDVVQSRRAVAVEDVRETSRSRGDPLLGEDAPACIAVPLAAPGGGLHGVLTVYASEPRTWRADEVQALVALGAMASSSLANARLYRSVAEEKERSEAILGNIADGIVAVDREGHIVLWNSMAERITGVPAAEALGRRVAETLQRELASGEAEPKGERAVAIVRGGKEVWLSLTEAVMHEGGGAVAGRIFAFRDISSERAVEQMKSDFVATVSHELRTPLTSIYGFAETLLRADVAFDETERATFLGYIASESERLIRIVDDLLNVARLEAGMLGLTLSPTDVAEVVGSVLGAVREEGDGRVALESDLPDTPLRVDADPARLAEVVRHLLDNAVQATPEGGTVRVAARRKSDAVELRVTDEGEGFSPADRQRIFTKFFRAEGGPAGDEPGTGLGLFLSRGLVAAMGGRMWVESEQGSGSSFVFELPVSKSAAAGRG